MDYQASNDVNSHNPTGNQQSCFSFNGNNSLAQSDVTMTDCEEIRAIEEYLKAQSNISVGMATKIEDLVKYLFELQVNNWSNTNTNV